ncbi:MAG: hypothetical protein GY828_02810 [Candidatus Gracilibacteria bacterium]|nr:hypothetical protein [Candidatus Gracilibacteria bacterium]
MTEIIKYKKMYKVIFKDDVPKIVSEKVCEIIKQQWINNKPVQIDDEMYSPFEIKKIIENKMDDQISIILSKEDESVQTEVKNKIRNYKNKLTIGVVKNMIDRVKNPKQWR